jgi:hypothetical protein
VQTHIKAGHNGGHPSGQGHHHGAGGSGSGHGH